MRVDLGWTLRWTWGARWLLLKHIHSPGRTLFYCISSLFQELGLVELLEKEEVQAGVAAANIKGDQEQASKSPPD